VRSVRKRFPRITEETGIKETVDRFPQLYEVFEDHGLHFCAGCYVMLASTIGTGANYSGLKPADRRALLKELNRLASKGVHGSAPASSSAAG
jgi:iron-sulfur cluster repair protein YtfE (RIC family)